MPAVRRVRHARVAQRRRRRRPRIAVGKVHGAAHSAPECGRRDRRYRGDGSDLDPDRRAHARARAAPGRDPAQRLGHLYIYRPGRGRPRARRGHLRRRADPALGARGIREVDDGAQHREPNRERPRSRRRLRHRRGDDRGHRAARRSPRRDGRAPAHRRRDQPRADPRSRGARAAVATRRGLDPGDPLGRRELRRWLGAPDPPVRRGARAVREADQGADPDHRPREQGGRDGRA